ncbi:kinesin-domain-containing protein [Peniophora sp. CONT]|nr:kinesin-domain-containing protein [Peniophora sp. CONT]
MSHTPGPTKLPRTMPFTPKRPLSAMSGSSDSSSSTIRPNTVLPASGLPSAKKYKAALSSDARPRSAMKIRPPSVLSVVPGSPSHGRPKTPTTPRLGRESPGLGLEMPSEMDVSRVDPEEVLIDYQNVEAGDVSIEVDEPEKEVDHGSEDKVQVSIRIRPSNQASAWDTQKRGQDKIIKLLPQHQKNTGTVAQEFNFDEILTGSENKPVYNAVARSHVKAAMEGYNAVCFAYGQTASGKTFTLSGDDEQPGIIPRALKDVFAHIRRTPSREYLLRVSYLEIYNETIHDLLAPPATRASQPVQVQGSGNNVWLAPLREEVVTSLKGVHAVLERGWAARRTATTDWNERSSRSHSVFRVVIESRERGDTTGGRQTPGPGPSRPPTPGGPRLQSIGGRSVQTSVLSLIDLAGSERATSDKERTKEGKYINTSLLTLGSVISTLAENSAKGKNDHVPFRNSKLTRMLQPSLSGDARISVICTLNPDTSAVSETTSTLLFASRIKKVALHAQKKEVVDTEALLERYRQEIEDLKAKLSEREEPKPAGLKRRLSAREQQDESKAMHDINARIKQLSNLILTSQALDAQGEGSDSRPNSPAKVDFDASPYQLRQELLAARRELETQATQILSLEAALLARPELPPDAPESDKDRLLADQARTICELEIAVRGYEENLGAPLRQVREDVEREWTEKVENEAKKVREKEAWAEELVKQLEKEKKMRVQLEEERRVLAAFVSKFDSLTGLGAGAPSSLSKAAPPGPVAAFAKRNAGLGTIEESPLRAGAETFNQIRCRSGMIISKI